MSYYMTRLTITPTSNEEERVKAISYFGKYSKESALTIHKKNKYKDINLRINNIAAAVIESKRRYFNDYSFIKIIL